MRNPIVALLVATLAAVAAVPSAAQGAPAEVNVRIEGKTKTLFEGPIVSDGHSIRGLTDTAWRRCNGLNANANPAPVPTPTAASADAMRIIGQPFDGQWYRNYEDYFVTRWGPDLEEKLNYEYWGIAVNNVYTPVGGCQFRLDGGDEVLWMYDAFNGRPRLSLYPADYDLGAVPLTATAELGEPFGVDVEARTTTIGSPPAAPSRTGATPYQGAEIAPVLTTANGFQEIDVGEALASSAVDGSATLTFATTGWHRIKATDFSGGAETVIRSNRLDVCVVDPPTTNDCGTLPTDAQLRTPPPLSPEEELDYPPEKAAGPALPGGDPGTDPPAAIDSRIKVRLMALDRSRLPQGVVGVRWRVLDPGPGVRGWRIAAKRLGNKGTRFATRASGTQASSAKLRLQRGASFRLRITFTDLLGRSSTAALGKVTVPKG